MSGYNPDTGIFELTASKASSYDRKPVDESLQADHYMEYIAQVLRRAGYEVLKVRGNYLRVKATQPQVWEALSGLPADPNHPISYSPEYLSKQRGTQPIYLTPTELGKLLEPVLSAPKVNQLLAEKGLQIRQGDIWICTSQGNLYAEEVRTSYLGKDGKPKTAIKWKRNVIALLQLNDSGS